MRDSCRLSASPTFQVMLGMLSGAVLAEYRNNRPDESECLLPFKDIEIKFLRHDAKMTFCPREIIINIDTIHDHGTPALVDQRADHANGGRLTCAIGPQEGEEITLGDF